MKSFRVQMEPHLVAGYERDFDSLDQARLVADSLSWHHTGSKIRVFWLSSIERPTPIIAYEVQHTLPQPSLKL